MAPLVKNVKISLRSMLSSQRVFSLRILQQMLFIFAYVNIVFLLIIKELFSGNNNNFLRKYAERSSQSIPKTYKPEEAIKISESGPTTSYCSISKSSLGSRLPSWLQMKNILFAREITGQYRRLLKCAKKIKK